DCHDPAGAPRNGHAVQSHRATRRSSGSQAARGNGLPPRLERGTRPVSRSHEGVVTAMSDLPPTSPVIESRLTKPLLMLGAIAGPLYILVGLAQMLTREGFDFRRHALSLLSNGEFGWIQIANFLVSGILVIAGAVGCRLTLRSQPAGLWGPILLGLYGI